MWQFKPEHKDTQIILRRHGIVATAQNITDSIGELITDEYPQYAHNIHEVDPKTKRADTPFRIQAPELIKKKGSLLTLPQVQTDGQPFNQSEAKQESVLQESKPLMEPELQENQIIKRRPGRPVGSSKLKK